MLIVLSGPSASGKDAIAERIISEHPEAITLAITATTRQPRPSEIDGVHYRFHTPETFAEMEATGQLLESATVYGLRYGVPRVSVHEALESAPIALIKTDVQGARSIKSLIPQALLLFVTVPTHETLERRMRARGGMDDETIAQRLRQAEAEIEQQDGFNYIITNEDGRLDDAVSTAWAIITQEAARPERRISASF